jgi:hypothetical protein
VNHKILSLLVFLIIFSGLAWLPTGKANADIGPKPTLEFRFSYPPGQTLSAVSGTLLGCKDANCLETTTLKNNPYVSLRCQADTCSGTLFSGDQLMRLQVLFSDHKTRLSNPFTPSAMRNAYSVKVQDGDLVVSRNILLSNNAIVGIYLALFPISGVILAVLAAGLLASNLSIEYKNRTHHLPFRAAPGRYLLAWILAAVVLVMGTFLTWALPLTVFVETGVAYLFYRFYWLGRKNAVALQGDTVVIQGQSQANHPPLIQLITAVVTVNLITQPLLWGVAISLTGTLASAFAWPIVVMELVIFVLEAILLRMMLWRHLKWGEAFLLGLLMNLVSYTIGLLATL